MSNEVQEAFERLLGETGSPPKTPQASAEAEAQALFALSRRLSRLRSVQAPPRLRQRALQQALSHRASSRTLRLLPYWQRSDLISIASRVAASIAVVILLGYTAVATSAASLPDSPLYSVKLLVEDVQVAVAPRDEKPQMYVAQAVRRLNETEALIQVGRIPEAQRTADDAARRIESAFAAAEQTARLDQVQEAIESQIAPRLPVLEPLSQHGPSPAAVALNEAVSAPGAASRPAAAPTSPTQPSTAAGGVSAPGAAATPQSIPPASVSNPVGAPAPPSGFEQIGPTRSTGAARPSPAPSPASAEVVAPRSGFATIGPIASPTRAGAGAASTNATSSPTSTATPARANNPDTAAPSGNVTPIGLAVPLPTAVPASQR